ncbi:hypothetical protein LAZ67_5003602 [Cordylochernes scorpioides]|uniref:Major facilitator superfamily (MFS) profile domain-containing protein n=1 Tax=Cordylochernes scorpioides TaxID=51811 RepID=A0ABY6KKG6_9ARAC|nr:hypothetical protein LAZ67_5003602 [Cordylochernes scorpioides]
MEYKCCSSCIPGSGALTGLSTSEAALYSTSCSQLITKTLSYTELPTLQQDKTDVLRPSRKSGLFIILVSFSIILLSEGMSFSFGILIIEIQEDFKDSQSKVAFIGSLVISFPLILGPVASYLTEAYGVQNMIIYGSFISAVGFYCGYLVKSINMLIFTVCISGFGLALIDLAAIVIIVLYFKKKRALATSLSLSGMGIGTIIFPPFISFLLERMAWREVFLVIGCLLLTLIPYGFGLKHSRFGLGGSSTQSSSSSSNLDPTFTTLHSSLLHLPTYFSPSKSLARYSTEGSNIRTIRVVPNAQYKYLIPPSYLIYKGAVFHSYRILLSCFSCPNLPLLREDASTHRPYSWIAISLHKLRKVACVIVDVSIFNNKFFALFCLSGFLYYLSLDTTYLYLPSLAVSRGLSKHTSSILITFIGTSNTIFMVSGRLGNFTFPNTVVSEPRLKPSIMFALSSLLNSLLMFALPSLHTLAGFAAASTTFGILVSLEYVFSPLIVIEFTTLDKFTSAYGLLLLVEGVATLVGPPLAGNSLLGDLGCTFDYFRSYRLAFYILGVFFLLSGLIVFGIMALKSRVSPPPQQV